MYVCGYEGGVKENSGDEMVRARGGQGDWNMETGPVLLVTAPGAVLLECAFVAKCVGGSANESKDRFQKILTPMLILALFAKMVVLTV